MGKQYKARDKRTRRKRYIKRKLERLRKELAVRKAK